MGGAGSGDGCGDGRGEREERKPPCYCRRPDGEDEEGEGVLGEAEGRLERTDGLVGVCGEGPERFGLILRILESVVGDGGRLLVYEGCDVVESLLREGEGVDLAKILRREHGEDGGSEDEEGWERQ